ncbi:MAG: hypothetical protein GY710_02430, partial [Desulfobacteraceae bacterium]|nr:hypothetical protein [Desulfobacteraceae bacterium]
MEEPERRKDRDRWAFKPAHLTAKEKSWERQATALDAPKYRITLTHPDPEKKGFNLGKSKEPNGPEQFFTNEDVKEKIPFLSAKNAQGYNIYVTPTNIQHHFIVLDDTTQEKLIEFKKDGFKPTLVQESSPGNFQAIFKVPKNRNIEISVEQSAATDLVKIINKRYGDPKIINVVHPFRMAGFTNTKPKYKDEKGNAPFVKVHQDSGELCSKMDKSL